MAFERFRPIWVLLLYVLGVVLIGALMAPWAFWFIESVKHVSWLSGVLHEVTFRRVFDRSILVVAAIGLVPLLRALRVPSWKEIGWRRSPQTGRELGWGVFLGFVSFAIAGLVVFLLGGRQLDPRWFVVSRLLVKFALTGLVVALIEETLFRGGLQTALEKSCNVVMAVIFTSALYSVVHFLKPQEADVSAEAVKWMSGIGHLHRVLTLAFQESGSGFGFVTLLLAGTALGIARVRTGALYFSVGLHAGWVFTQKTFQFVTITTKAKLWWGGGNIVESVLTWPLLVILMGIVLWLTRRKTVSSGS